MIRFYSTVPPRSRSSFVKKMIPPERRPSLQADRRCRRDGRIRLCPRWIRPRGGSPGRRDDHGRRTGAWPWARLPSSRNRPGARLPASGAARGAAARLPLPEPPCARLLLPEQPWGAAARLPLSEPSWGTAALPPEPPWGAAAHPPASHWGAGPSRPALPSSKLVPRVLERRTR